MIETRQLTRRFGSTTVVDELSLTAPDGQVTGFVGPNGSGKTTTIRMMVGLVRPSSGHAHIDGRPLREHPTPHRAVGVLMGAESAPDGMTARQHLGWMAAAARVPAARADHLLEEVGLGSVMTRRIRALSLGMRQRLGIAAALLGEPGTVILDEPVNGLDPDGVRWIRNLMRRLAGEGRCVLVSSHLMAEMQQTADRAVVIGRGRLLGELDMRELDASGTSLEDAYMRLTADAIEYQAGATTGGER